jgi:DNA-binding transcriptional regulator YiaG
MKRPESNANSPTPEQVRQLRLDTNMSVDSATKIAGLATRRSWYLYEQGHSMMPPSRWKRVLAAVEKGAFQTTPANETGDIEVTRKVGHVFRRMSAVEIRELRAAYLDLAGRLGMSMRELAARTGLNHANLAGLFKANQPKEQTYQAIRGAMRERLAELQAVVRTLRPGQQTFSGDELSSVREVLGLSQQDMALLLGHSGDFVGRIVSEYERGIREVPAERTADLWGIVKKRMAEAEDMALWKTLFDPLDEIGG